MIQALKEAGRKIEQARPTADLPNLGLELSPLCCRSWDFDSSLWDTEHWFCVPRRWRELTPDCNLLQSCCSWLQNREALRKL